MFETKLQKIILFIGGLLIAYRLYDVPYKETYSSLLYVAGIAVFVLTLLIVLRGYELSQSIRLVKKNWKLLMAFVFVVLVIAGAKVGLKYMANQKLHKAEVAYQHCLDKVASTTEWTEVRRTGLMLEIEGPGFRWVSSNKYFTEWADAGRPNYNNIDHWEIAFMKWMVEKYPDFCTEYNVRDIKYFLSKS
ncbi:MAG: hypothetical protein Q7S43_02810 [bacterium]|nr:hypothetical protein [bacterium]MDO8496360.1 hypothetical protein [bacterium]